MSIRPLFDSILVEPEKEEETKSGIIISSQQDLKKEIAKVIRVGQDVTLVKPDDYVLIKSYSVDEVKIDDKDVYFIKESDILALVDKSNDTA